MDWFKTEKIDDGTIAITEPLHPEAPHSYLVMGDKRAVLIDTGLGIFSMGELVLGLTDLPITVLTTHAHWDHVGSHWDFERIAIHPLELGLVSGRNPMTHSQLLERLYQGGFKPPEGFDPDLYTVYDAGADFAIEDGDILDLGGRILRVMHTPGHSPGSCSFYEAERKYLFCGDLLYDGALYAHLQGSDPAAYRASMSRISQLEIERLLPGHNSLDRTGELAERAAAAFDELYEKGLLKRGAGKFGFGDLSIIL
ncbi:MAG: MBL fold metallo-hydrolase [Firmicutes bacterium]|nr:MBL fold metallo-hydrolase [Bacillota bacterium]